MPGKETYPALDKRDASKGDIQVRSTQANQASSSIYHYESSLSYATSCLSNVPLAGIHNGIMFDNTGTNGSTKYYDISNAMHHQRPPCFYHDGRKDSILTGDIWQSLYEACRKGPGHHAEETDEDSPSSELASSANTNAICNSSRPSQSSFRINHHFSFMEGSSPYSGIAFPHSDPTNHHHAFGNFLPYLPQHELVTRDPWFGGPPDTSWEQQESSQNDCPPDSDETKQRVDNDNVVKREETNETGKINANTANTNERLEVKHERYQDHAPWVSESNSEPYRGVYYDSNGNMFWTGYDHRERTDNTVRNPVHAYTWTQNFGRYYDLSKRTWGKLMTLPSLYF